MRVPFQRIARAGYLRTGPTSGLNWLRIGGFLSFVSDCRISPVARHLTPCHERARMTIGLPDNPDVNTAPLEAPTSTPTPSAAPSELPEGYSELRADPDIQYAPIEMEKLEPREPSWFEQMLEDVFRWLGELFGPLGHGLTGIWPVLKWVLLAALIGFVLFLVLRLIGPLADRQRGASAEAEQEPEWQPDRAESLALLEDADQLAAEGRFDEAAHLLLQRSVGQIASARPEWVDPSSTARELAALPRLSDGARRA